MSERLDSKSEPISKEFKEEVITKTIRDISSGSVVVYLDTAMWREDALKELMNYNTMLFPKMLEYISGPTKNEENKELIDSLFRVIFILKGKGVMMDKLSKEKIERHVEEIDARFEAMRKLQMELLLIMREIVPKLEEVIRKVDRLGPA